MEMNLQQGAIEAMDGVQSAWDALGLGVGLFMGSLKPFSLLS